MPPRLSKKTDTIVLQVKVTKAHKRKATVLAELEGNEGNVSRLIRSFIDAAWEHYETSKQNLKVPKSKGKTASA
jgi:hypothetical protein